MVSRNDERLFGNPRGAPDRLPVSLRPRQGGVTVNRAWVVPTLCLAAALVLYLTRLDRPSSYVLDETYHAYTAGRLLAGDRDAYLWNTKAPREGSAYTWNHPPAGLWIIAGGIAIWGDRALGWRFSSAVFGVLGAALAYLLALRLTGRRVAAELTLALLLLEGLWFVQSRVGMLDIFGAVFVLAALLAFHEHLTADASGRLRWLLATGLCLGLAIATKWNAAYPSLAIGLIALGTAARRREPGQRPRAIGGVLLALVLVPIVVYLGAYLPFFATGHTADQFVELHRQMLRYHSALRETHSYQSRWWEWPLLLKPMWYHVTYGRGTVANIYAQGNPALVWLFVPAVAWLVRRWWRERRAAAVTLAIGFLSPWLPWALVPRPGFFYYFLPSVPFGVLAVSVGVADLWESGRRARMVALGYVTLVAIAFAFFHPIYAAVPLTPEAFSRRVWLPGWR